MAVKNETPKVEMPKIVDPIVYKKLKARALPAPVTVNATVQTDRYFYRYRYRSGDHLVLKILILLMTLVLIIIISGHMIADGMAYHVMMRKIDAVKLQSNQSTTAALVARDVTSGTPSAFITETADPVQASLFSTEITTTISGTTQVTIFQTLVSTIVSTKEGNNSTTSAIETPTSVSVQSSEESGSVPVLTDTACATGPQSTVTVTITNVQFATETVSATVSTETSETASIDVTTAETTAMTTTVGTTHLTNYTTVIGTRTFVSTVTIDNATLGQTTSGVDGVSALGTPPYSNTTSMVETANSSSFLVIASSTYTVFGTGNATYINPFASQTGGLPVVSAGNKRAKMIKGGIGDDRGRVTGGYCVVMLVAFMAIFHL